MIGVSALLAVAYSHSEYWISGTITSFFGGLAGFYLALPIMKATYPEVSKMKGWRAVVLSLLLALVLGLGGAYLSGSLQWHIGFALTNLEK